MGCNSWPIDLVNKFCVSSEKLAKYYEENPLAVVTSSTEIILNKDFNFDFSFGHNSPDLFLVAIITTTPQVGNQMYSSCCCHKLRKLNKHYAEV